MALEPVPHSGHELAHAVNGPTYRANHERIFGKHKRDVPESCHGAPEKTPAESVPNPEYHDATPEWFNLERLPDGAFRGYFTKGEIPTPTP